MTPLSEWKTMPKLIYSSSCVCAKETISAHDSEIVFKQSHFWNTFLKQTSDIKNK